VTHDPVRPVLLSCCRRQPKDRAAQRNRPVPCPCNAAAAAIGFHAAASFLPLQLYDLIPFLQVPLSYMCESAGVWRLCSSGTDGVRECCRRRARVLGVLKPCGESRQLRRRFDCVAECADDSSRVLAVHEYEV
jgi:hypothetical protein